MSLPPKTAFVRGGYGMQSGELRALFGERRWRRWTVASFLCRFPQPMSLLAFQIAGLRVTGSIGKGALLVGITGFCGLLGPWAGRKRDRGSMRRRLQASCFTASAALGAMAVLVGVKAPFLLVVACAIVQGSAIAGTWSGFRALLVRVLPGEHLHQAHFVESLMVEIGYGVGPLVVTAIVVVGNVTDALVIMAVTEFAGALTLQLVPDLDGRTLPTPPTSHADFPLRDIILICSLALAFSLGFALIETNIPARMHQYGLAADQAGVFMALLATGSCIGGLAVSIWPLSRARLVLQAAALFALFGLLSLPSALAGSVLVFLLVLPFNSLPHVPLSGLGAATIEQHVGIRNRGEAFGYFNAATRLGSGLGATLNGVLLGVLGAATIPLIASGIFLAMPFLLIGGYLVARCKSRSQVHAQLESACSDSKPA